MATCQYHQTDHLPVQHGSVVPIIYAVQTTSQQTQVTYSTSAQSAAMAANTRYVTITTGSTKAHIAWGTNPTATADYIAIAANGSMTWEIPVGQSYKFAAYDGSS